MRWAPRFPPCVCCTLIFSFAFHASYLQLLETEDARARAATKTYNVADERVSALHLACGHRAPPDVIHTLILSGQPMMESTPSGLTPLHCALTKSRASPETVRLLLDAFPHDVSKPCSRVMGSKTPLHLACENKASSTVIRMLHDTDPAVADQEDVRGLTPLDIAKQYTWILNPNWRRKVNRILKEDDARNGMDVPEVPVPSQSPSSSARSHRRRSSSSRPPTTQTPVVATATLVTEDNIAGGQVPVAAATLVDTPAVASLTPTAPPDSLDTAVELEKGVCVLCWDKKAEMALVPCGHVCLCTRCCGQTEILDAALNRQCPVCRKRFHQTLRVYAAGITE